MKVLKYIDKIIALIEKFLVVIILLVMIALSCIQIGLRNIFASGITSSDIILRHLTLWLAFLGASLAAREGKHLKIDVIPRLLSERYKHFITILIYVISVVVCCVLAKAGWTFVALERESDAMFAPGIPLWYAKLIIPGGCLLIAFRFILKTAEQFFPSRFGRDVEEATHPSVEQTEENAK